MSDPERTAQSATTSEIQSLQESLARALAVGPSNVVEQVQCVLDLSAQIDVQAAVQIAPAPPLTSTQARVIALTALAEHLSDAQLVALFEDVQQMDDLESRLSSSVKLALLLPPHYFQPLMRTIWGETPNLIRPDARARVLFQLTPLLTLAHDEPTAPTILLEIVSLSQAISNPEARVRSLMALVPYLPHTMRMRVLHRILDEIDRLHTDTQRSTALSSLAHHLSPEIEGRALRSAESIQTPAERAQALTALARQLPLDQQPRLRRSALNAIATIADEEARSDALIAFAPHLEYITDSEHFPQLLEQALGIAISIKRRHLRARVLVALAPHLTLDLQGEALAAVHNLGSERERAALLAQLAPTLPPNMLVASMAVAHSMVELDARVQALTALAHYAPPHARERTMLDALAAASSMPHRYERVSALVSLVDVLPPQHQAKAYADALEAARLIDNESARARALSMLVPGLPTRLHERALEAARNISNPEQRLTAMIGIARGMSADAAQALGPELLADIRELPFEYKLARAIGEAADLLSDPQAVEALNLAHTLEDPLDRLTTFVALIPHLPAPERRDVVIEAWQQLKTIDNGYDAASLLNALAPLLPKSAANDLAHTAGMIIGSIMDEYDQVSAITLLAPLLAAQDTLSDTSLLPDKYEALGKGLQAALDVADPAVRAALLAQGAQLWVDIGEEDHYDPLWQDMLYHLATLPLADAILALGMWSPLIRQRAGNKGVAQIAQLLNHYSTLPVAESD
ncbi:MAG: hypothetical protein K8J31_26085 [Anaerolineae bacterium]|nr:hypothetical protein [Anaerolineae bacterium]